jgi:hypothetical protein
MRRRDQLSIIEERVRKRASEPVQGGDVDAKEHISIIEI